MVKIFDSVLKKKVDFIPMKEDEVKIYLCGPTVYDNAHLGHARSLIGFDMLYRVLKTNNYEVIFARNYTDIDDKIINKAKKENKNIVELTSFYIDRFEKDCKSLNILEPTYKPKATQNLENMKKLVSCLLDRGYAYKIDDGIYLDTSKDKKYGIISHKIDEQNSQSRIKTNDKKRNQKDFALWKFSNDLKYNADFGDGRPGWHCECSAMIDRYLSDKNMPYAVDIHCGGIDLLFPHHENEASQTRLCYNQEIAKYWMHNGFVNIDGKKMSKSLGNSFYLKDALSLYHGEVIRIYLLSAHYRADFNFNELDLKASKKRLDKLYRLKKIVYGIKKKNSFQNIFKKKIIDGLNDDLNTPVALSIIDEFINYANEKYNQNKKDKNIKQEILDFVDFIYEVLGIGGDDAYKYFQFGISEDEIKTIEELLLKRDIAKKEKNYQLADKIRDELLNKNINIMDTPNGVVWEKI